MNRIPLAMMAAALFFLPAALCAQGLSADERRIADYVDRHQQEAVDLLERTVNINSGTLNPAGVRRVYDVLAPELARLGFEVRYAALPAATGRGGHLVATRKGTRGRKLLLIGHLDTVFEEGSPFQRFTRLDDSTAAGPGVEDMKGGNVVIVQALRALDSVGALDGASITVVMTGDEESAGSPLEVARAALIEAGREADVALGFEGGTRDREAAYAVVARRSSSRWRLEVTGRPAHSSGIFRDGVGAGAIYEAARVLDAFYGEIRGEEGLTFNAGLILGGTEVDYDPAKSAGTAFGKTNVIPEKVVVNGDIRTLTDAQLQRTRERMRAVVERGGLPGTRAEITFQDSYPSMSPTDANYELLTAYSQASQALGLGGVRPHDPTRRGAADISFVAPHIEAGLDGLGVYGSGAHTVEETVDLRSIPLQAKRAAVLIYRLTR